jgi:alkylation response protein AidB-like acyl-CoA dehydrogenase
MTRAEALSAAQQIAAVAGKAATQHDQAATFHTEAVAALGKAGLLGLCIPTEYGGAGLGPAAFADVVAALAEADGSLAMVYVMHTCASRVLVASPRTPLIGQTLRDMAAGKHLGTLAFSEKGSRSHFWAPVSRAVAHGNGVRLTALKSWVTSAGHAHSYVTTTLSPDAKTPTDSTLYLVPADAPGCRVAEPFDGMGLRANASSPVTMEAVEVSDDRRLTEVGGGFSAKLDVVLPFFNLGSAAMSLGLCRGAVGATVQHLKAARLEHMGSVSLGEAFPTLRAVIAEMQLRTDALGALVQDTSHQLENPGPVTMLRVLESKAFAGDTAIEVTCKAMHACGGAAFSKHLPVERIFRDAHASAVMAPTGDVLKDFIGKALLGLPLF